MKSITNPYFILKWQKLQNKIFRVIHFPFQYPLHRNRLSSTVTSLLDWLFYEKLTSYSDRCHTIYWICNLDVCFSYNFYCWRKLVDPKLNCICYSPLTHDILEYTKFYGSPVYLCLWFLHNPTQHKEEIKIICTYLFKCLPFPLICAF